jgi:hypothetical protein
MEIYEIGFVLLSVMVAVMSIVISLLMTVGFAGINNIEFLWYLANVCGGIILFILPIAITRKSFKKGEELIKQLRS